MMPAPTTEILIDDGCCLKAFQKASVAGRILDDQWTCPKCGVVWRGKVDTEASVRTWSPVPAIAFLRLRE